LEFFLKATAAAADYGAAFFSENFNSDRFFSTFRTREELWQTLLWDTNNFASSSAHHNSLLKRKYAHLVFMLVLKYLPATIKHQGYVSQSEIGTCCPRIGLA
jgi:hypothetical protein